MLWEKMMKIIIIIIIRYSHVQRGIHIIYLLISWEFKIETPRDKFSWLQTSCQNPKYFVVSSKLNSLLPASCFCHCFSLLRLLQTPYSCLHSIPFQFTLPFPYFLHPTSPIALLPTGRCSCSILCQIVGNKWLWRRKWLPRVPWRLCSQILHLRSHLI